MKKYIKYLLYILEHKKNVFIECWKAKMYSQAFTHDLSKFRLSEFIPYARYFYGNYPSNAVLNSVSCINHNIKTKEQVKEDFEKAWALHYKRNPHHPEYWNGKDMSMIAIKEMICDLRGMSRKFGDSAEEYYLKNYYKWNISDTTRLELEFLLDINDSLIHNYGHTLGQFLDEGYDLNEVFDDVCERFNVDLNELIKGDNYDRKIKK